MPPRRQIASWALLVYIAVSLSALVAKQTATIATSHTHNPYLFTAHFTEEVYLQLDEPFKPRLFSYLLVAAFLEPDLAPTQASSVARISAEAFERLVSRWSFVWFLGILLLYLFLPHSLLYMLGTFAAVSFAYTTQGMVFPYDLPALFFFTLIFVLVLRQKTQLLPLVLGVGTGFKETVAVFSVIVLFFEGSWKERLKTFGLCLVVCLGFMISINDYAQRDLIGMEAVTSVGDEQDAAVPKLLVNLREALEGKNLLVFVNAGFALPLFLLPAGRDRLGWGFKAVGALFALGLFLFAAVVEARIWFEIIPLCLYSVISFLGVPMGTETDIRGPFEIEAA